MFFVFKINVSLHSISKMGQLSDGVIGNTSDFGSEESRFDSWSDNNGRKDFEGTKVPSFITKI